MLEVTSKLEKNENDFQLKLSAITELKQELANVQHTQTQQAKIVTSLMATTEPLKVFVFNQFKKICPHAYITDHLTFDKLSRT